MTKNHDPYDAAKDVAAQFAKLGEVEVVWLGGSQATGRANAHSDIDLYIYSQDALSVEARASITKPRAREAQLDNPFWEVEDFWLERESGTKVEAMYRKLDWEIDYLEDLFRNNRAQMGFSTSRWHAIRTAKILFDREGRAASLQRSADVPYPDALAHAIIKTNFALLRGSLAAHPKQIAAATARDDLVFVHSRIDALLDSYFDVVFALNRALHSGAKRQLTYAEELRLKPERMREDVTALLTYRDPQQVVGNVEVLIDRLEALLVAHS